MTKVVINLKYGRGPRFQRDPISPLLGFLGFLGDETQQLPWFLGNRPFKDLLGGGPTFKGPWTLRGIQGLTTPRTSLPGNRMANAIQHLEMRTNILQKYVHVRVAPW